MVFRLLFGIALLTIPFSSWRLFVRKSRLQIHSDRIHFPTVTGSNLERQEFEFPRDFAGDYNLLFVPFLRRHQSTVDTWIPLAQELEITYPWLVYYELPTIDERPVLSRTFINEGMRAGIPDQKSRERTVTLYIDTAAFRQVTGIPNKQNVHILLVNRDGDITWRTTGSFTQEKGDTLREVVENISQGE